MRKHEDVSGRYSTILSFNALDCYSKIDNGNMKIIVKKIYSSKTIIYEGKIVGHTEV